VIDDSALLFQAENGKLVEEKLRTYAGVHDVERLPEAERKPALELPSLLGRDAIYSARAVMDENRQVFNEKFIGLQVFMLRWC
jgi:hypothetical protein